MDQVAVHSDTMKKKEAAAKRDEEFERRLRELKKREEGW